MPASIPRRTGTLLRSGVATLCISALAACAHAAPQRSRVTPGGATVIVRNHHGSDLRVYLIAPDGTSYRLGLAPRFGSAMLPLPRAVRLPAELTFVVIPLSHDDPQMSERVEIDASAKLLFTVGHDAALSRLTRLP